MRIVSSAPGRCGIVGNPTDMYGGSVIACSTRERAECVIETGGYGVILRADEQSLQVRSHDDLTPRGDNQDLARVAVRDLGAFEKGVPFALSTRTSIPMQAGLAGSTAMLTAIVGAILSLMDRHLSRHEMAELIRGIEYRSMGVVCGFQDAYMAVFGGLNYMDFRGKDSFSPQDEQSPLATVETLDHVIRVPSRQPCAGMSSPMDSTVRMPDPTGLLMQRAQPERLPFVLAHTGVKHHSGTVHKSPRERWRAGEPAFVDGYAEVARLAGVGKRALLRGDWPTMADQMNRNHAIVRDLGGSGDANEAMIAAALAGGAIGAKLAGAGGGGTILALTLDPDRTIAALVDAGADAILRPEPSTGLSVEIG